MSAASQPHRGRGRPRRPYRIRVVGERRTEPDYDKLARALLEHAAMQAREKTSEVAPENPSTNTDESEVDS